MLSHRASPVSDVRDPSHCSNPCAGSYDYHFVTVEPLKLATFPSCAGTYPERTYTQNIPTLTESSRENTRHTRPRELIAVNTGSRPVRELECDPETRAHPGPRDHAGLECEFKLEPPIRALRTRVMMQREAKGELTRSSESGAHTAHCTLHRDGTGSGTGGPQW